MKISFKNIAYLAVALLGISSISSCSNDLEQVNEPEKERMSITVSTSTPSSRVSLTEQGNNIEVKWTKGDYIYVGVPTSATKYVQIDQVGSGFVKFNIDEASISEDGKSATFTASQATNWEDGTKVIVAHGRVNNIQSINNTLRYCYYKLTHRNKEEFLQWYALMGGVATVENGTLSNVSLQHMGALIKFQFSGLPTGTIKQIILQSEDHEDTTIEEKNKTKLFFDYVTINVDNQINSSSQRTFLNYAEANKEGIIPNVFEAVKDQNLIVYRYMPPSKDLDGKNMIIKATYDNGDIYVGTLMNLRPVEAGILYTTPVIPMTAQQ